MRHGALLPAMALLALLFPAFGNAALLASAAPNPSPNPIPALALALDPSGVSATPTNYAPGICTLTGTLTIDKIPGERLIVSVIGSVDLGWAVQCNPSAMVFMNNKANSFTVNVVVPMDTPASSVGTLRIEAEAQSTGFSIRAQSQVLVTVAPYYLVYLDSPQAFKEVPPAHPVTFSVEVRNWGNADDSFDLYVMNMDELANKGWTVSFSSSAVPHVGAMQSKIVNMFVQPPFSSTLYKYETTQILVTAVSQNSRDGGGEVKQSVWSYYVCERGTYIDGAAAVSAGLSVILFLLVAVPVGVVIRGAFLRRKRKRTAKGK